MDVHEPVSEKNVRELKKQTNKQTNKQEQKTNKVDKQVGSILTCVLVLEDQFLSHLV